MQKLPVVLGVVAEPCKSSISKDETVGACAGDQLLAPKENYLPTKVVKVHSFSLAHPTTLLLRVCLTGIV